MQKVMIGVCEFSFPCWGELAIKMAKRAGFEGMQLADCGGSEKGYPFSDPFVREVYLQTAYENGIALQAIHLHTLFRQQFIDYAPQSAEGGTARESVRKGAEACRQMEIPAMMVTVTNVHSREQYDNVCDCLAYAKKCCADNGVRLVVETDLPPAEFYHLQERVGGELTLCFDTMNPTVYGIGRPAALIEEYGIKTIDHFHIKDCRPNARGYFTKYTTPFTLIGQGESGFADCAEVIRASGYSGWVISETFYFDASFEGDPVLELAARDAAFLRKQFGDAD